MNAEKGHSQSADNSQLLAHKSSPQGGHAFKLKAPYKPTGDQPQAIEKLVRGFQGGKSVSDASRCDRVRKDVYHGQCDPAAAEADADHCP